jgi:hypothetical protein
MLLIYPPIAKPCEPPPGVARLAGALNRYGVRCTVMDLNIASILASMHGTSSQGDKWTSRAVRNREADLQFVRSPLCRINRDKYKRAVMDLNRLLEMSAQPVARVSLSNYSQDGLSPVCSTDLLKAAEHPEANPFYPCFSKRLEDAVETNHPSMAGISLNFLSQALCTFAMLGFLRKRFPELKLVIGGGLVTSWARKPGWRNPFEGLVDHLVAGPGESVLLSLAGMNNQDGSHSLPDFRGLPLGDYLSPGTVLPYSASTGCYWNKCSFCPERAEKNPYVPVPPGKALDDIETLIDDMRPGLLHLLDNAVSPAFMQAIVRRPPGIPWYGFVRITEHLADVDFCRELRGAGCVMLKLGIESGDQEVIDREHKGIDLGTASRALRSLHAAGIATYVYLLFGTPSETLPGARSTLEFTVRHSAEIDFLNLAIFNLPVYGPETDRLGALLPYEGDLSLYTGFAHPEGWDRGAVRQYLDKEFKRHPAVARILRNDPPFFTSNHAPFFCDA